MHAIPPNAQSIADAISRELDQKTKPRGSLGALETLAIALGVAQRTVKPSVDPARVLVFAADHGVCVHGVSAFPSAVTAQMVMNYAQGGAAINVLSRVVGAELKVVDVGVDAVLPPLPGVVSRKVRRGTADFVAGPAMRDTECAQAMAVGAQLMQIARQDGVRCVLLGEMGIGNTTSAACLLAGLLDISPARIVGRGTGVDQAGLRRKRAVVTRALKLHDGRRHDPVSWLAAVGGLEIAALVGAMLAAREHAIAVLVDGFIVTAAAAVALAIDPATRAQLIFSHRSAERGHRLALNRLQIDALLDLDLRLGEGSGAALAFPLARAACAILADMATFHSAQVSGAV